MKNDVRLSRKELRRQRTACGKQTPEDLTRARHKAASRERTVKIRDWDHIFKQYGVPEPAELRRVIDDLIVDFRDRGVTDYAAAIFDPGLTDLTQLAIGVLDHKEERLPLALIPETREELRVHCERMIIRNCNAALVNCVVDGWPGSGSPKEKLSAHVNDLWELRSVREDLYCALVSGRPRAVILHLWKYPPPSGVSRDRLRRILICHSLLWCTNDVQLVLARNSLAERNPFGRFILSNKRKLEPERMVNDLKDRLVLLRNLLELYVTASDEDGEKRTPEEEVPDDPVAQLLEGRIEQHAEARSIDLLAVRSRLDAIVPCLQRIMGKEGKGFRKELDRAIASNRKSSLPKHFHGVWFSDLSNLQASAVPILRYMQAEAGMGQLLDELTPEQGKTIEARESMALPGFRTKKLQWPWRDRASTLLRLYRRELLDDADFDSRCDLADRGSQRDSRSCTEGRPAITAAKNFLVKVGDRRIMDHEGDQDSIERTFYLLDVIPEVRFAG